MAVEFEIAHDTSLLERSSWSHPYTTRPPTEKPDEPMGIVAAESPGHRVAGPDHGPIHVDRQPRQVEPLQLLVEEVAVQGDQRLECFLGELLEPVDHRAVGGDARQPTEPGD